MVSVYNSEDLIQELSNINDVNDDVIKFYKNFSFENIVKENNNYINSSLIFKDSSPEESNNIKVIQLLNKVHNKNINKTITSIKEIHFKTLDELQNLVNQCVQKIKRENEQIKPLIGMLCSEILSVYYLDTNNNNNKIYFKPLILTNVKKDYFDSIDYCNNKWSKENCIKTMTVIGTLYNSGVVPNVILESILNDFKKSIEFNETNDKNNYVNIEKSIQLLFNLSNTLAKNDEINEEYENMESFINEQIKIYSANKKICKKSLLELYSCVDAFKKLKN